MSDRIQAGHGALAGPASAAAAAPAPPPCLVEPGLLPPQGILFVGGEPKVGKSLLVANLALSLAAGRTASAFPSPRRAACSSASSSCRSPQFVSRLAIMRRAMGAAADRESPGGYARHRPSAQRRAGAESLRGGRAKAASAEIIVLDPLYSTHDQDENDTRAMAALCQALLRLRDAASAALVVVHHVRKSIGRYEIGSAFRGSSALHAVGDSYMLLTRPSPQLATVELRFQFRYAAPQPPRLLELDPQTLWFSSTASAPAAAPRRKVEKTDITQALANVGEPGALQPTARRDHESHRMFQTHCATGHRRGVPARLDRAGRRPLPPAVKLLCQPAAADIDCPRGVAPERMPRADATELAPKKSALHNPPAHAARCGRVVRCGRSQTRNPVPCGPFDRCNNNPISLVKFPSGGLGLLNAKTARPLLPGAPCSGLLGEAGIPLVPTHASILSRPSSQTNPCIESNPGNQPEIIVRSSEGKIVARYTLPNSLFARASLGRSNRFLLRASERIWNRVLRNSEHGLDGIAKPRERLRTFAHLWVAFHVASLPPCWASNILVTCMWWRMRFSALSWQPCCARHAS